MAGEPIITVVGNLTADPDLRYVGSGIPVASFTVASTPRTRNRQTNEWENGESMFIRCSVWREYAENVTESLAKGMRVVVTGRLQMHSYQRNDGTQGSALEMQVDEIGPSLRYATAKVQKTNGGSRGENYQGSGSFSQGGQGTYDAPAGGSANDMWAQAPHGGSSFDDNPPF